MRFTTCYSITMKRGFFVYQSFYYYDRSLNLCLLNHYYTSPKYLLSYFSIFRIQHKDFFLPDDVTIENAFEQPQHLGIFFMKFFTPHCSPSKRYAASIVRSMRIHATRGRRMLRRLPVNGQRTRSNNWTQNSARIRNLRILHKFF